MPSRRLQITRYEAHSRRVLAAFLQHVIAAGFPRIRYFGFPANRSRKLLGRCAANCSKVLPAVSARNCDALPRYPSRIVGRENRDNLGDVFVLARTATDSLRVASDLADVTNRRADQVQQT